MLSKALNSPIHVGPTNPPTDMHQVATQPVKPRKRRSRRKRYIIFGSIGLLVLWIVVSTILGKREKPIPVTTEKAIR